MDLNDVLWLGFEATWSKRIVSRVLNMIYNFFYSFWTFWAFFSWIWIRIFRIGSGLRKQSLIGIWIRKKRIRIRKTAVLTILTLVVTSNISTTGCWFRIPSRISFSRSFWAFVFGTRCPKASWDLRVSNLMVLMVVVVGGRASSSPTTSAASSAESSDSGLAVDLSWITFTRRQG